MITFAGLDRTGSRPIFTAGSMPLPAQQAYKKLFQLVVRIMAQPLTWLVRSSRAAKAMCLMNGYSIFNVPVKEAVKSPFT